MANFNASGAGGYYRYVSADSTEAEESSDSIQSLLNETGSEVSGLSHLDAPNDSLYMIGGVLIAMFLVGMIIILLAVTIRRQLIRREATLKISVIPIELKPQLKHIYVY